MSGTEPLQLVMAGISSAQFRTDYLGRQPFVSRIGSQELLIRLTDIELLDRALWCTESIWVESVRVACKGNVERAPRFDPGTSPYRWLYDQFRQGRTLILEHAERLSPEIATICAALCDELLGPVQAKAFVTPPHGQAFEPHYDGYELFVVQLAGTKRWRLYESARIDVAADCPIEGAVLPTEQLGVPYRDLLLSPGEVLYVPRGWGHDVTSGECASWHVSFGCVPFCAQTYWEVQCRLAAHDSLELRKPIQLETFDAQIVEGARESAKLQAPSGWKRPAPALVATSVRSALQEALPSPCGLLSSGVTSRPTGTSMRIRPALLPVLVRDQSGVQLSFNGLQSSGSNRIQRKSLVVPEVVVSLVEQILAQKGEFRLEQLQSSAPPPARDQLVTWLWSEGFLEGA